jgi:hypothetical protein
MLALSDTDARLVALGVVVMVVFAAQIGAFIARRPLARGEADPQLTVAQSSAFGVLALLLAFSFSVGLSRLDARRAVVVHEANAIDTLWNRADLLDATAARDMRTRLRAYAAERLAFVSPDSDEPRRELAASRSGALQAEMWRIAMTSADRRLPTINLLVPALNETADVSTDQAELQSAEIPQFVLLVLLATSFIAALLLGLGSGTARWSGLLTQALVALMLASK